MGLPLSETTLTGVTLILKHFPGDGASYNGFESHAASGKYRVYPTEGSLETYQLVAFQAAIDAGAAGIMPGYSLQAEDGFYGSVAQSYRGTEIPADEEAAQAWKSAFEEAGFSVVSSPEEADIAFLDVVPGGVYNGNAYVQVLDLVEGYEVDEVGVPYDTKKTGETVTATTLKDVPRIAEIADAVHANGGIVISSIDISNPWILTNLEPYCDGSTETLTFDENGQARITVSAGESVTLAGDDYDSVTLLPDAAVSSESGETAQVMAVKTGDPDACRFDLLIGLSALGVIGVASVGAQKTRAGKRR